ncbi:uncharacterized protein MELLADRAFT_85604 [Melampsora larici-populina 98AG31]|uniref:Uncharacterized protein n=1 Tax=Melampsora larici-populina (strain 98AG31 / pathotype 3-4-7) TaxID=747676 RepID=F4SDA0_MELLP|nr:uncharacterized protein MELLADRAFT_85604 [Melampsora larici-populina 98AG31]EGF97372.1 hypothetical protein MELLADRAFT_85604 [Melampsora larici-populina 98AG31]
MVKIMVTVLPVVNICHPVCQLFEGDKQSTVPGPSIKQAPKYAADKASELTNTASKEVRKEVAKEENASMGTRATASKVDFA